jgi:hypothetical protein
MSIHDTADRVGFERRLMMRNEMSRFAVEHLECRRLLSANPAISIGDVALTEGQDGATAYVFAVSLSHPSSKRISVQFATVDGSAQAGEDYAPTSGTLNFARGETTKTVTVLVNGDTTLEGDETFSLQLRRARSAFIADHLGIGTIVNDDDVLPPPPADEPPVDPGYADPWYPGGGWDPGWGYGPYPYPGEYPG